MQTTRLHRGTMSALDQAEKPQSDRSARRTKLDERSLEPDDASRA
jgi:hypothetical protein